VIPLEPRTIDLEALLNAPSFAYRRRLGEDEGSITVFIPRSAS
jgi:hypothetical protein